MIIKLMKKLSRTQQYFAIVIGIPLWVLICYILGSAFGPFGAIGWIVIFVGFLIAEAWMDCTN
jgi:hypothetical protein